ncbi:MAG: hypothetical protein A3F89_04440 [Deltaproteobacteria bacterium RIFCSPLOWO2_12_FULL_50_11]|nr:MAG: hypothetical protein A3F89_04440 [Deltaproteobacteria bacterium RIFCSPLOWO2_12_FULL_50_11]
MKFTLFILSFSLVLFSSGLVFSDNTAELHPLVVDKLRVGGPSSEYIAVSFNSDSMPGCYSNDGGLLYKSHPQFKEIYALLLMIKKMGPSDVGQVWYQPTDDFGNINDWAACVITGVWLN